MRYEIEENLNVNNYKVVSSTAWQGRIDSETNYDAFRWHQWVKKIDLNDPELEVFDGEIGFAFIGFCSDLGVQKNKGRIGAAGGPKSIRKEMANLPCRFSDKVKLFDAGNIYTDNLSLEEAQELLSVAVKKILKLNLFPIVLGGGHEVAFGHYNGLKGFADSDKKSEKIGIFNFDAHFDLRPYPNGGTSGTMFRQIADNAKSAGEEFSYFALGIQTHRNTVDLFKTADALGAEYIVARDIVDSDIWSLMDKIDKFIKKQDKLYITVCTDVFSSAYAPGVSATQPLGLTPDVILKLMKYIIKSEKVLSFDIAEVSPRFDQDNTTSNLASVIIFSVIEAIANNYGLSL